MREIQLREAKAKLSEVVDGVMAGETAIITRHGRREAVLIGWEDYTRLKRAPTFGWLLGNSPVEAEDIEPRKPRGPRGSAF